MTELIVTTPDELREFIRDAVREALSELADREPRVEWLDTQAAAAELGEHPKTTARRARNGDIPARRLGNQWRFRRSDLESYLATGGAQ